MTSSLPVEISGYSSGGGRVESDGYAISFLNDGVIVVNTSGTDIVMYDSDSEIIAETSYSAAVRYSGKSADNDADADIIAAMDDGAEVIVKREKRVFIGENIKFVIDRDGTVSPEEIK